MDESLVSSVFTVDEVVVEVDISGESSVEPVAMPVDETLSFDVDVFKESLCGVCGAQMHPVNNRRDSSASEGRTVLNDAI